MIDAPKSDLAPLRFRGIAAVFVLGAAEHAGELVAGTFGHAWRSGYPAWRHALFALLILTLAVIARRAPRRLWLPMLLLLAQQSTTHGRDVWLAWSHARQFAWLSIGTMTWIVGVTLVALQYRFRRERQSPVDRGGTGA